MYRGVTGERRAWVDEVRSFVYINNPGGSGTWYSWDADAHMSAERYNALVPHAVGCVRMAYNNPCQPRVAPGAAIVTYVTPLVTPMLDTRRGLDTMAIIIRFRFFQLCIGDMGTSEEIEAPSGGHPY